ncbi:vanadium-dependent haloperoxidase [Pseudonocardia sp. GCM10023141]|uniref:vanadium-dependent haloperoxidase n=1 Tax=Pseudonocardia sp. GCM10023141 TaxID=3252653 RepID=UPI003607B63A
MRRRTAVLVTVAAAVAAAGISIPFLDTSTSAAAPAPSSVGPADVPGSGRSVIDWNRTLISILATPGNQPATVHPTRSFAMLQAAEYNAVVSVTHSGRPYRTAVPAAADARPDVAADQAAHDVLAGLYPSMRPTLDGQLATELAALPAGPPTDDGIAAGAAAAQVMLTQRASDGATAAPPAFVAGNAPGDYRPTPPAGAPPMFTGWGAVTPFLLTDAGQFRPAPPTPVSTPAYVATLTEVKDLGRDTSTTRTADQTAAGRFWSSAPIWTTWNQVAQQLATVQQASLTQATAAFANLDLALADTTIALYDAKYQNAVWRPITAIRAGLPAAPLAADPAWNPLTPTAADPSYPGAHSALSAAAAPVLTAAFGPGQHVTVSSAAEPGVTRSFPSIDAVADEAGLSRIWAGQHTRLDHEAGQQLGRQVGGLVLDALPVPATAR